MAMAPRRTILDSLHRCLCPQPLNSLSAWAHGSVTASSIKRLSLLSTAKNFSTPTGPSQSTPGVVPEGEPNNNNSIPPIRKIAKEPDIKRVTREQFYRGSPILYKSPASCFFGVEKVIDMANRGVFPGVFYATEEVLRSKGYVPDTRLYTVLIEACGNFPGCLLQPLAIRLFKEMKEKRLQLNSEIYHSLLRLLATSPDYLTRSEILDEMRQGWYELSDDGWEDVISGYILDGQLEVALGIIEKRRRSGQVLHRNTYKDIIQGLCKVGEVDEALRFLRELEADVAWVTPPALVYSLLVAATERLHLEATLFCWRKIIDRDMFNPDDGLCLATLNVAARYGDPSLATDVFRVLGNRRLKFEEHHYAALLESYAAAGDLMAAFSVLSLMREAGVAPVENTARPIITRLTDKSSIERALDILKQMKANGKDVDIAAINALVAAHVACKDIDAAFGVYKEMPEFDLRPETRTFNIILKLAAEQGREDFAANFVDEMKEMGVQLDVVTYENLFNVSLAQDNYEDAFVYLEEMRENTRKHPKPRMYKRLATKCYRTGDSRYHMAMGELASLGVDTRAFVQELRKPSRAKKDI